MVSMTSSRTSSIMAEKEFDLVGTITSEVNNGGGLLLSALLFNNNVNSILM